MPTSYTIAETLDRQERIEHIEGSGFVPRSFISGRGIKKDKLEVRSLLFLSTLFNLQQAREDKARDHESAVFGPAWRSKELNKKLATHENKQQLAAPAPSNIPLPSGPQFDPNFADFPLAQQWVSQRLVLLI